MKFQKQTFPLLIILAAIDFITCSLLWQHFVRAPVSRTPFSFNSFMYVTGLKYIFKVVLISSYSRHCHPCHNNKFNNELEVAHAQSVSSSTWFLVELEFANVGFLRSGEDPSTRTKTSRSKGEDQQQTLYAYTEPGGIDRVEEVAPLGLVAGINFIVNGGGEGITKFYFVTKSWWFSLKKTCFQGTLHHVSIVTQVWFQR